MRTCELGSQKVPILAGRKESRNEGMKVKENSDILFFDQKDHTSFYFLVARSFWWVSPQEFGIQVLGSQEVSIVEVVVAAVVVVVVLVVQLMAMTAASATAWSFSTVLPDTPTAPTSCPAPFLTGTPPGNVISPLLECSMLYNEPPG